MKSFGIAFLLSACALFMACSSNEQPHRPPIAIETFDTVRTPAFVLSDRTIRHTIDRMRLSVRDTVFVDLCTNRYYADRQPYLWISRNGVDSRADSLLARMEQMPRAGISSEILFVDHLRDALQRARSLDYTKEHTANQTLACLEYYLTKAYLRYVCGQRFGFVDPRKFFNRMEWEDTLQERYRPLFDFPVATAGRAFVDTALTALREHRLKAFLDGIQPSDTCYNRLREAYSRPGLTKAQRRSLAAGMEHCRWRIAPHHPKRYVFVNLPAWTLEAVDRDEEKRIDMRICAGSSTHKTPLLASQIRRMELNPHWIVPQSIIKNEIAPAHAQESAYFERNGMCIIDKETQEEIAPESVTADMLLSGRYSIRQEKGEKNSLGRIIFRFPNDFAIYLHDTPNRTAFTRTWRGVSHGCIRLEEPLLLADFLFGDDDPERMERIRLSIDLPPETAYGRKLKDDPDFTPFGTHTYKEPVPVFIGYRTVWPDAKGQLRYYPDVYNYDESLLRQLDTYTH